MAAIFVILFFVAFGVALWAGCVVMGSGGYVRFAHLAIIAVATVAAVWTTYGYEYYPDENTRICGWPTPVIIFQRHDHDSPWLDFVGPTTLLALPMNLIVFMFVPSVVSLGISFWSRRTSKRGAEGNVAGGSEVGPSQ